MARELALLPVPRPPNRDVGVTLGRVYVDVLVSGPVLGDEDVFNPTAEDMRVAIEGGEHGVGGGGLEEALSAPEFIAAARAKLNGAPIGGAQRRQLDAGLLYVSRRDYELAVPLLIVALEGAFVSKAERRRLVERAERKLRFTPQSGRSGNVGGLEAPLGRLGLEEDLDAFLRREVYGGRGNPFRHGRAQTGWCRKALSLPWRSWPVWT